MKYYLLILLFSVVACSPLFRPGFYTSHDGESHLVRLAYFSKDLKAGNLFPRWQPELNKGLGYPVFVFTYPLPYYLASIPVLLGFSIVNAFKITVFLSIFLGGWFFLLWTRKLIPAIIYIFTPYHFLNLYVRAAFGELVFLAILPLVFWAIENKKYKLFSLFLALAILSHLQLSLIFLPVIIIYAVLRKINIFIPVLLSLGLSSFFWLPSYILLPSTMFSLVKQFPPADHLITLRQLIYSPWGFGFSKPGLPDGLSFQLGFANWLGLVISSFLFFRSSRSVKFIILITWLGIILIISNPFNLWSWPIFAPIQFPWRLLAVPLFFIPLFISQIKSKPFILLLLLLTIYSNRNHIRINLPQFEYVTDQYFYSSGTTTATPDEFMPKSQITNPRDYFSHHPIFFISQIISLISLIIVKYRK